MNLPRKYLAIGALAVATMAAGLWWSWQFLDDQRSQALAAAQDVASCRTLADQIMAQHAQLTGAGGARPTEAFDLTRRITAAAGEAKISPRALDRIETDPPRHTIEGDDPERVTRVALRDVTIRQVLALLARTDDPSAALRVQRIRLTMPSDAPDNAAWSAEATFVQTLPAQAQLTPARQ